MNIYKNPKYNIRLTEILKYIAVNNSSNAKGFKSKLDKFILNLINSPYKFRQSNYFENENIRDLIFKGFTIPYLIDLEKNRIIILDIFKYQQK